MKQQPREGDPSMRCSVGERIVKYMRDCKALGTHGFPPWYWPCVVPRGQFVLDRLDESLPQVVVQGLRAWLQDPGGVLQVARVRAQKLCGCG
eukprot:scaffold772_cov339-Pavlova_lutheri.AAC.41